MRETIEKMDEQADIIITEMCKLSDMVQTVYNALNYADEGNQTLTILEIIIEETEKIITKQEILEQHIMKLKLHQSKSL